MRSKTKLFFIIILIYGFIGRLGYLLSNPSLWSVEIAIFQTSKASLFNLLSGNYWDFHSHPFLAFIILKIISILSIDERWLRFPSFMVSFFSIIVIYFLSKELFQNRKIALLSSLLFSSSTYNIMFSSMATTFYGLSLFLSLISCYFFIRLLGKKKSIISFLLFVLFSFLALISDYSFLWLYLIYFFVISVNLFILKGDKCIFQKYLYLLISLSLVLTLFLPWLPKFITSLDKSFGYRIGYITKPSVSTLINTPLTFLTFFKHDHTIFVLKEGWWNNLNIFFGSDNSKRLYFFLHHFFFIIFIILSFRIIYYCKKEMKLFFICGLVALPLMISYFISQKSPIFLHRNLMIVQIGLILLFSEIIYQNKKIGAILLVLYFLLNLLSYDVLMKNGAMDNFRGISRYLAGRNMTDKSMVIISPDFFKDALDYYKEKDYPASLYTIRGIDYFKNSFDRNLREYIVDFNYEEICFICGSSGNLEKEIYNNLKKYSEKSRNIYQFIIVDCFKNN